MNSTVRMVQNRIQRLFSHGLTPDEVLEQMEDEDADLVGLAWQDLRERNKIPPAKGEKRIAEAKGLVELSKRLLIQE